MGRTLTDVLVERERLLARCEQQRVDVAGACRGLAAPAAVLDRFIAGGRYVAQHPVAVAAIVIVAMFRPGRNLVGLAVRGVGIWRLAQRLRPLLRLFDR